MIGELLPPSGDIFLCSVCLTGGAAPLNFVTPSGYINIDSLWIYCNYIV